MRLIYKKNIGLSQQLNHFTLMQLNAKKVCRKDKLQKVNYLWVNWQVDFTEESN